MQTLDSSSARETSATQAAYVAIHEMLLAGTIAPGEKLKIERLRLLLDIGASPIREALSLLTSDMLVERLDQRGFRAATTSKANFEEILTLRCSLEEIALTGSLANATPSWEEKLVLIHHRMKKSVAMSSEDIEELHKTYHMTLLENCNLPILLKYCSQLYDLNIRYRNIAGRSTTYQKRNVLSEHEAILNAVVNRDTQEATTQLLNHYRLTGSYLSANLSS